MSSDSALAAEIVEMTKDMDLRFDRSAEESVLLDIVLKAKIIQRLERAPSSPDAVSVPQPE